MSLRLTKRSSGIPILRMSSVTVETVVPDSVEHSVVVDMINAVDNALSTDQAEQMEEAPGTQPYQYVD